MEVTERRVLGVRVPVPLLSLEGTVWFKQKRRKRWSNIVSFDTGWRCGRIRTTPAR